LAEHLRMMFNGGDLVAERELEVYPLCWGLGGCGLFKERGQAEKMTNKGGCKRGMEVG